MTLDLTTHDALARILDDIWSRWTRGRADRRSPFHTPVIATTNANGAPDQRVMVLRHVDRSTSMLRFHTDRRSAKTAQIADNGAISILGYDSHAKIQARARGTAIIVTDGPDVDAAWKTTSMSGRRCYLADPAPGTVSQYGTSGLPLTFENTLPSIEESELGRINFALVMVSITQFEWLYLAASGHRRAAFTRQGDEWGGKWLVP